MDTMFYKWSYVLVRALEMIKACYYPDLCVSAGGGPLVPNEATWRGVLSHLTAHKHTEVPKQTENSFKRDGWSQERSSTHDEALCMQLLMCFWKIHSCSAVTEEVVETAKKKRNHLSVCCCYDKRNCTVIPLPQMIPLQLAVACKWTRVPTGIR